MHKYLFEKNITLHTNLYRSLHYTHVFVCCYSTCTWWVHGDDFLVISVRETSEFWILQNAEVTVSSQVVLCKDIRKMKTSYEMSTTSKYPVVSLPDCQLRSPGFHPACMNVSIYVHM